MLCIALQLIEQEKISDITGVPTQTWELLNHPERLNYDLSSLKTLGAPSVFKDERS